MSSRFDRIVALLTLSLVGCAEYDPPPEASLVRPEGGAFTQGELIHVEFSEPVAKGSFAVTVWPNDRNVENEISASARPFVDNCVAGRTCGDLTVKLAADRESATLQFEGELGKPGRPLIVEVLPGLRDDAGNDTRASKFWDVQFRTAVTENVDPVEFDDGVYILLAQVDDPIPAVLTLISDVKVLEDGRFALVGAEGDEINGAPKNTRDPENLIVDETDQGWVAYAVGTVTNTDDGKRLLETDPFDLTLPVGPLTVRMDQVRLFADIVKNEDTGKDRLDGTLSFESLVLSNGEQENEQPGGGTALIADFVPPELEPDGIPRLCGDLCGGVVLGLCETPGDFPEADFCATAADEESDE